jgi:glutathione-independent formaldehyde dehydrogenase
MGPYRGGQAEFLRVPFADFNCLKPLTGCGGLSASAPSLSISLRAIRLSRSKSFELLIRSALKRFARVRKKWPASIAPLTLSDTRRAARRIRIKRTRCRTIRQIAEIVNPTGSVGLIGVYFDEDPGGVDKHAKKGEFLFPLGKFWNNGITIGQGQAPVKKYNVYLRNLIIAGKAKPSFIVSHRLPLSKAVEAYAHFDHRGVGAGKSWTKVLLKPDANAA